MIEIVHVGLGPLGQKMIRSAVERGSFRLVGAVDVDPAKIGRDLGEFCGIKPTACGSQPFLFGIEAVV